MASFAELQVSLAQEFGMPWRLGDIVAGKIYIYDQSKSLFSPSNSTLSATAFQLDGDATWDDSGQTVSISTTATDGVRDWSFEPDEDDLWRVVFTLDGDYKAKTEVTTRVHDPEDDYDFHRPGDTYIGA